MKVFVILLIALAALSAKAQDCPDFIQKGTSWEMTTYNAKGKILSTNTCTVDDIHKEGVTTVYSITGTTSDKKGKQGNPFSYNMYCKNGKVSVDMKSYITALSEDSQEEATKVNAQINATELSLPDSDEPIGTKLNDGNVTFQISVDDSEINKLMPGSNSISISVVNRKVIAKEKKTTPAGTFDCVVVSETVKTKTVIGFSVTTKTWYVKGLGAVATESYTKKGKFAGKSILTKFSK